MICSKGLIPKSGPINFTKWLDGQKESGSRGKLYMIGELYAKFIRTKVVPAIRNVVGDLDNIFFQDDQDTKHRTQVAIDAVNEFFLQRISPEDCDAKLADCWPIERVWGILKEKLRGKTFQNQTALVRCINKEWNEISAELCKNMMNKIPDSLLKVIENEGEQIFYQK